MGYRQVTLWLNRDELAELIAELRKVIVPRMENTRAPDRSHYLLSPILFPIEERPRHKSNQ